ncbi:lipoprotein [Marmoricola endophyticus]|uniref:Lipoprotein n=1 Tax=Marmoricola endophyticus TaxID=2040280 RepID=A0A917BGJ8_9ACTN|nr:YncE family protein [Marmoricola endophyticus]GGF42538.1 lipoprotein [Marmoricola endophyticus]
MSTSRRVAALGAATLLACTASCGGGSSAEPAPKAAPATSPRLVEAPAGTVTHVAPKPQGIVYDPGTRTLSVAVHDPDRLLVLDPETLAVEHAVPLPGKARHVKLGRPGGPVLVPDETSDRLYEVAPATGRATSVGVGAHPHDAVETAGGAVVVGNEFGHELSVVRGGRVVGTVPGFARPGGLVTDGDVLAALDDKTFSLTTYALPSLTRTARVHGGVGTTHAAATTGHREVVVDTAAGRVRVFDLDPLREVGSTEVGGVPYGIATDRRTATVWVTLTAENRLVGLDVSGARPRVVATYPTVRQPDTVAVAPGAHTLWVTGTRGDEVERITR